MARLNTFVHVHREGGLPVVFGPEDEVPDWAVKAITNPSVWADEPAEAPAVVAEAKGEPTVEANADAEAADTADDAPADEPAEVPVRKVRRKSAK